MLGRVTGRGRTSHRTREPQAVRITEAPSSPADDIRSRQNKYLFSMALRTVCVIVAVLTVGSWIFWVALLGAVVLPYVAVIVANVAGPRTDGFKLVQAPDPRRQLPAGHGEAHRPVE